MTIGGRAFSLPNLADFRDNRDFYREFAAYAIPALATQKIIIGAKNDGPKVLNDVRIEFVISEALGILVVDELPDVPQSQHADFLRARMPLMPSLHQSSVNVKQRKADTVVSISLGKLQIGATEFCDPFRIGLLKSQTAHLEGWLYADELPRQAVTLKIEGEISFENVTNGDMIKKSHDWLSNLSRKKKSKSDESDDDDDGESD